MDAEHVLFDLEGAEGGQTFGEAVVEPAKKTNEAKRSISYVMGAVLEFGKVSGFADLLDRVARLHIATGYSPFNALLMLLQLPAATHVLPAHQWKERYGFVIRPGEQPMVLLQPGGPVMFLLDVTQVEPGAGALPLPAHLSNPYAMADVPDVDHAFYWIVENAKFDGVRVTPARLGAGFAGCVSPSRAAGTQRLTVRKRPQPEERDVPVRFDVELNRSYLSTEKLATIAHELGHVYCGHLGADPDKRWKDRSALDRDVRELEAESVARVVFASLAPGARLPDHLSQYFEEEPNLAGASLEAVLKAAGRILDIANGWGPAGSRASRNPPGLHS
ncbi:ImmA/IrrE family metallo-endopeptidase [Nocardioides astragali]|uniref:ImmA/IrrE family metallo-endopeptidase n=1 Tax=Nocardioides astragali TaxID=1776736 RepID=A0ABW2MV94_9ACTN|nr:ImmA/IrrE family metallo-endopeptidase [Nocardioides astragali]